MTEKVSPKWKIIYYESPSGQKPVFDFIENLSPVAKSKVINSFNLLTDFGINMRQPHVKKISGTDLWEIRILGQDSLRFFYKTIKEQTFLLLHGFTKKKQKTPKKEINTARRRLLESQSRY
ncbi:type II toxin-antitoxin system RelE/ParE family toxin [Candidatus Gottesmanbacteria bacterium]|nr:type II toxin-antitoxin system RelE/ParE family toxin [Candidatus Gottesmanbacteria bacterium]